MRLIGAGFGRFACFEKAFVPLGQGLNLLVGKNNTGKTAILRGLSLLDALPVAPVGRVDSQLLGYARAAAGEPNFGLHLVFEPEHNDLYFIQGFEEGRQQLRQVGQLQLRFSFRVFPRSDLAGLDRCDLTGLSGELAVIERRQDDFFLNFYNRNLEATNSE